MILEVLEWARNEGGLMGQWLGRKAAKRAVHKELADERIIAEGTAEFLLTDGVTSVWAQVHVGATEDRIAWALIKRADAPVMLMRFDQLVRHSDEGMTVELTERDPEYAAMFRDPSNPYGETDAIFRFDASDESAALRSAILARFGRSG